ncbi:MAG TPA: family 20 glycosylhydrolase [Candidatus Acidoferrales bacterium]|nr:family 20 glycosylhydrolase [Candidatus Acidoferrales bacterium]
MPIPASIQVGSGQLVIQQSFSVAIAGHDEARLDRAVQRFLRSVSRETGMAFAPRVAESAARATLVIHADRSSNAVQDVDEDESYVLEITSNGAQLAAPNPLGIMRGLETFLQLIRVTPEGFAVPTVRIDDRPRFLWRGLFIDVSRHFIPLDVLKRNLDGMAALKMNVFHWHLSENQGFRIESRVYPKLHELGSDGFFYTQAEARELIDYARDRGIRVVPEFDMPGHSTSWFVGYPELASAPGPYQLDREWGIFDPAMDPTKETTYKFLDRFIGEMSRLFPDPYFHIGGDEVNGKQWDANQKIQAFMEAHNIADNHALQAYFNARIQKIVSKHGKLMIGWEEILAPNLPKNAVVQSWHGQETLADAARQGFRSLLSYGYYLDLMWPAGEHYANDPLGGDAAVLTPQQQTMVLGGEACMWSEYVSSENIDSRIWPRTAAIAERLWSPQNVSDTESMYRRSQEVSWRLERLGLTHRTGLNAMLRRMAGSSDVSSLAVLADVLEPMKDYGREEAAMAAGIALKSDQPLNRLVDAVAPESDIARKFSAAVDTFIVRQFHDRVAESQIRALLVMWRDNDARLEPLLQNSFLLKPVEPLSRDLASLGAAGSQAIDYLDRAEAPPADWKSQQIVAIEEAKQPQADLLLAVAAPVQRLVEAASRSTPTKP